MRFVQGDVEDDETGELTLSLHVCMDGIARRLRGARCQRLKVPA